MALSEQLASDVRKLLIGGVVGGAALSLARGQAFLEATLLVMAVYGTTVVFLRILERVFGQVDE